MRTKLANSNRSNSIKRNDKKAQFRKVHIPEIVDKAEEIETGYSEYGKTKYNPPA
jgi:ribosomal protein L20